MTTNLDTYRSLIEKAQDGSASGVVARSKIVTELLYIAWQSQEGEEFDVKAAKFLAVQSRSLLPTRDVYDAANLAEAAMSRRGW